MEDAVQRVRQGMKAILRQGSGWKDVAVQVRALTEFGLDPRHFLLCTDDSHSETLVREGHVDRALRVAIEAGVPPMTAIQMATLNTAEHFGVSREVGMIAPGRYADILLVRDLEHFSAEWVYAKGKLAVEDGNLTMDLAPYLYPEWVKQSVHLKTALTPEDFILSAPGSGVFKAHVIGIVENQAPTRHLIYEVPAVNGQVQVDINRDLAKIAVVERHQSTGRVQVGLVHGFGLATPCAIATTVAHDSHHMIVMGTSEIDMALAANELRRVGGGQVVVKDGKVIGLVDLPIAGLMSSESAEVVARKASTVLEGFKTCGCTLNNPNMQLSLSALVVIPELRISDLGLVDVTRFQFIPVLENLEP